MTSSLRRSTKQKRCEYACAAMTTITVDIYNAARSVQFSRVMQQTSVRNNCLTYLKNPIIFSSKASVASSEHTFLSGIG